ncbi:hypothetical protein GPL15_00015 [Clostridium sp. MCC353]|uniref:hypothetical protein n=1 Tax=Clostridium sp. MCC353 TaxID=2592646 RepID=UPI001C017372|nr:hypothetical protein [Clostridium sp. MCC353]MBT9774901.1 hypothetical protein [Clostridium sp. MCC353]
MKVEEMTYTSIVLMKDHPIRFSDLEEDEKERAANQLARRPLEELGEVHIVKHT